MTKQSTGQDVLNWLHAYAAEPCELLPWEVEFIDNFWKLTPEQLRALMTSLRFSGYLPFAEIHP